MLVQGMGKLKGDEAHGLLQEATFAEGQFLILAYEQKLLEDIRHVGEFAAFQLVRILPVSSVPVLAGVSREVGPVLEGFNDRFPLLDAAQRTQADIGREQPAGMVVREPAVETGSSSRVAQASVQGVPLILPNQDLTVAEATILRWLKAVGDTLAEGEPVVEAETDKAVFEVESPAAGVLAEILVSQGQRLAFGTRIGTISPTE